MAHIELSDDQLEGIMLQELRTVYELECEPNRIDCSDDYIDPDLELLKALDKVIEYYSSPGDYQDWLLMRSEPFVPA